MRHHPKPNLFHLVLLLILWLPTITQADTVQIDYDDAVDFSEASTFAWKEVGPDHPVAANPLTDQLIREAIEAELEAKGFRPHAVDAQGPADLELVYHAAVKDEMRITDWGRSRRWGRQIDIDTYKLGTLVLDILRGADGELVWRGAISDLLPNPKQAEKRIAKGARKLLRTFPPSE